MMTKIASRFALIAAAIGLAIGPVAAQANTRAGDFSTAYTAPASHPSTTNSSDGYDDDDDDLEGAWILAFIGGLAIVAGIIILADGGGDNDDYYQSPGAN